MHVEHNQPGTVRPGLVSVTFRDRAADDVVRLAAGVDLEGIEWGGDVHVPHGRVDVASRVGHLTRDAGLEVVAYGSYYVAGNDDDLPFEAVLDTASALGAPLIRVWAGERGSAEVSRRGRARVVDDSVRIAEAAAQRGILIAYEYHRNTLTDTAASTRQLIKEVDRAALTTLWQPVVPGTPEDNQARLRDVLIWLTNVHVFAWADDRARLPLERHRARWRQYLAIVRAGGGVHWALLEFVREADPDQLRRDAQVLQALVVDSCTAVEGPKG